MKRSMLILAGIVVVSGLLSVLPGRAIAQDEPAAGDSEPVTMDEAPPGEAAAPPADEPLDGAMIAWMLTSSALVLMMTAPGLALFYGGLVRKKNILGVMMQCVFLMGLNTLLWGVVGFSLAFGGDNPWFGNFDHVMMKGVIADGVLPTSVWVSKSIFFVFQGMFFIITPALICGAFAERMKFSTMCVFCALWGLFVYCPVAHWVWSDAGWLCEWNADALYPALDFAGGTVVHISSGVSALLVAIMIGPRTGFPKEPMPPHNLTYTCIGAALLWVGWFGFNAGSALSPNEFAVNAFVATHMCAACGVLGWSAIEWIQHGKPSILGACSGAVAGLVCITPACGSCTPASAIILGLLAGVVCYFACAKVKGAFGYDDSLDAFGVHGVGGTLGALLTGVFASSAVTGGRFGVLEGDMGTLVNQIVSILATIAIALVGTFVILIVLKSTMGLRVSTEEETQGLDLSQHGEEGYIFL
jgi:Amt family ammonium transporter